MKVFIDTNIFVSAALFPAGSVASLYAVLIESGHEVVTSDYVLEELRQVVSRKFPARAAEVENFIEVFRDSGLIVTTPVDGSDDEVLVRDEKDRPVLRGARRSGADVLLTGDKGLLAPA